MSAPSNPLAGLAFRGPGGEERAFKAGVFLRAAIFDTGAYVEKCQQLGIKLVLADTLAPKGVIRAMGESINTSGGFLAPNELQNEILSLRDLAAVFRSNCRVIPMSSDTRSWPRRTSGFTPAMVPEGQKVPQSTAAWDAIMFVARKLATLVLIPSELAEDATAAFAGWLVEELAYAFADYEDNCGFNGDGTSVYYGKRGLSVLAVDGNHNASKFTAAAGHNTFGTLDAVDIAGLIGILPEYAAPGASWYVSQIGFANTLCRLAQGSGVLGTKIENGQTVPTYLGWPVRLTPKLPAITSTLTGKVMMLFGDLKLAGAIGYARDVTVRTSPDRFLDLDQIGVLGSERFDLIVHSMGDNAKAGPIVALVAP